MANELSRKGIAFGAAVALGSTLIAGGAANAAPNANYQDLELTVADSRTYDEDAASNGVLATTSEDDFGLVLSWNGDVNTQNFDDLTYVISYADADVEAGDYPGVEDGQGYGWSGTTYAYYDTYEDQVEVDYQGDGCYADMVWDAAHAGGTFTDTEDEGGIGYTGPVAAWDATSAYAEDEDEDGTYSEWGAPFIDFGVCYTPDEKAVATVQAFIDTNQDGDIDSTESHSAAVNVTFWNPSALTPVLTLENDGVLYTDDGEDYIGWEVTFAEPLNDVWTGDTDGVNNWGEDWYDYNSVWEDEDLYVESYVDGEYYDTDYVFPYYSNDVLYDYEDEDGIGYDVTDGAEDNGSSITKVRVGSYNNETDETTYTAWQTVEIRDITVDSVEGTVVEQKYVDSIYNYSGVDDFDYDFESGLIRDDVKSLDYVLTFTDVDGEPVANADVEVELYDVVTDWNGEDYYDLNGDDLADLYNDDYGLTVNGETFNAEDYGYFVNGTTNADGELTLNIEVENPDEDLYLGVNEVHVQGMTVDSDGADLWWDATVYDVEFESGVEDEDTFDAPTGGDFTFDVYVADQWGNAPADDVRIGVDNEDTRGNWDYAYFDVNSNGVATVVIDDTETDPSEADNSFDYNIWVEAKDGSGWDDLSFNGDDQLYINWLDDDAEVSYVTGEVEDSSIEVTYGDWVNGNWHFDVDEDATNAIYDSGDYTSVYGYVHAENGYNIGGADVTISGSGLFFEDDEGTLFSANSINVKTDEDGYYEVWVYAHEVGEHTVTITAAGKSTTVDVTVNDGGLYASAVAVSPFTGKAGTSENITATVTDKWGNLVPETDVTFSVTGGGYFVDDVATTGGSANEDLEDIADAGYGQATEMLVILSNEVGYGSTVTATIDVVDPYGVEEDTTASASLAAGATDFGKPAFWTKDIGNGEIKLYAKNIVGAGKIQFFHNGKEVAWIKAVDALDPKLRAANGSYYLVRTLKLVNGKNVFEIKDDGERVVRRVASK